MRKNGADVTLVRELRTIDMSRSITVMPTAHGYLVILALRSVTRAPFPLDEGLLV